MSDIRVCPKCGGRSKLKRSYGIETYQAVQDHEVYSKVHQMKKLIAKNKNRIEELEGKLKKMSL